MKPRARGTAPLILSLCAFGATELPPRSALAGDCSPRTAQSTCFDADQLWVPAAPSRFVGIPRASAGRRGTFTLGLDATYLSRPVVMLALSPDPAGRQVRVVDDVLDAALSGAWFPVEHLELSLVVPAALFRTGTGETGVTTQTGPSLSAQALRDVRLGAAQDLVEKRVGKGTVAAGARLDLALPTGDEGAFAGERDPVLAPSFAGEIRWGRVYGAASLGARLRRPVPLGGVRLGSQLVSMLGIGVGVLPELDVAAEAWALPTLLSQDRTLRDGVRVTDGALVPAEWMLSVRLKSGPFQFQGGFGTAIPLSGETRRSPTGVEATDHFAGVGTPRIRGVLILRYAPDAAP
ncbi:MAG TPA: hypothetical protein VHE30_26530 [Polyangiaceae bacterium]|nr:hypothetical protein [Polyangiaceae bacterium]